MNQKDKDEVIDALVASAESWFQPVGEAMPQVKVEEVAKWFGVPEHLLGQGPDEPVIVSGASNYPVT